MTAVWKIWTDIIVSWICKRVNGNWYLIERFSMGNFRATETNYSSKLREKRFFLAELQRAKRASEAPWVRKIDNPSSRENLVMTSPYECPSSVLTLGDREGCHNNRPNGVALECMALACVTLCFWLPASFWRKHVFFFFIFWRFSGSTMELCF